MQDRVQLNREEIVGDGTALSNINPLTDTKSVDDALTGESLDVIINRIWNAINNKLSRIVNSVNGRDGVIVITAKDVGLGNVTNVSFSTIKDWVLDQLLQEFNLKRIQLFDTYDEFIRNFETWELDKSRSGIPFYIKIGGPDGDTRSQLGYTTWDNVTSRNNYVLKPIDTIYEADKSIIYNENINGKNYFGGKIGVNIWTGEDALKIYEAASKGQSGLYIDKKNVASALKFFNCIYGNGVPGDPNALVYILPSGSTYPEGANHITIYMNDVLVSDPVLGNSFTTYQTFKVYDLVLSNFADTNCRDVNGNLKSEFLEYFVNREACVGSITDVEKVGSSFNYTLKFYTVKPYVGKGLGYIDTHTQDGRMAGMIGLDLVEGAPIEGEASDNLSGLNAYAGINTATPEIGMSQSHITVTPYGPTPLQGFNNSSKAFIAPDFSLSIIPYNTFSTPPGEMHNWPMKIPGRSVGIDKQDFFGVNLLKRRTTQGNRTYNMSGLKIYNDSEEISNATIGKNDSDTDDKLSGIINRTVYTLLTEENAPPLWGYESGLFYLDDQGHEVVFTNTGTEESPVWSPAYTPNTYYIKSIYGYGEMSGGLAVNVGKFLEIGTDVGSSMDVPSYQTPTDDPNHYYDGGKVNLRVDDNFFTDTNNDNRLTLKISRYTGYSGKDNNAVLGGGLTYSSGTPGYDPTLPGPLEISPGLTINRGLGLRMSHYDKVGQTPNAGDKAFLAASVIDTQYTSDDIGQVTDDRSRGYGGLRYFIGDSDAGNTSAIGLRVNASDSTYGHQLRLGDRAIGIDERNVVQVQRYRESDAPSKDTNPLVIKGWDEEAIYPYVHIKGLTGTVYVDSQINLPGKSGDPYGTPKSNRIYFVKDENKRYVWTGNGSDYVTMFTTYDGTQNGEWNRVYVETIIDNVNHTFVGNAYQWTPAYTVQIPGSWIPDSSLPEGGSYRNDGPSIDAVMASAALKYYACNATLQDGCKGYYDSTTGRMCYDMAHQVPMTVLNDGWTYADMTYGEPYLLYTYKQSTDSFEPVISHTGSEPAAVAGKPYTIQDLKPMDVDNNGLIDAVDASTILAFYVYAAVYPHDPVIPEYERATNARDQLNAWLKYYGIAQDQTQGYELIHGTDPNGSFMPGLDINLNKWQGITSELNGDIHNSVSVKIYDRTAGVPNCATEDGKDPSKMNYMMGVYQGGLRFNKEGYLGVRVNAMNTYNSTTPSGRDGGDFCRCETYKNGELMHDLGARGLRIYGNNVLGIQLDVHGNLDNGQLAFDEDGSLIISPQYHGGGGGGELLTITDNNQTVSYNGSEAVKITLGPGLMLEPDPTPEPNSEQQEP